MPIFYKNREIKNLTIGDQIVNAVYYGTYLIWEAIPKDIGLTRMCEIMGLDGKIKIKTQHCGKSNL